jgi:anthranilate synthase component 1
MRPITDRETYRGLAAEAPATARIPVEVRLDVSDPFLAYRRARQPGDSVLFETTGGRTGWSYFAVEPSEKLTVGPEAVLRETELVSHTDYAEPSPSLAALEGFLDDRGDWDDCDDRGEQGDAPLIRGPCDVPFPGGVFGWLSYDIARELESLPDSAVDDRGLPRVQVARYETVAAWEEPRGEETTLRICATPRVGDDPDAGYDRALAMAESLAERATNGDPSVGPAPVEADTVAFESDTGREAYADRVRAVREYVHEGDTFQANISHRLRAPAAVHPVETYDALRRVNPAPYSALVEFRGVDLVSASPELLLHREPQDDDTVTDETREGAELVTEPIAGTRPRGETPEEDEALAAELRNDEKERAEHAMLVDLERNDLGKVSVPGSVTVPEYRRVDRYAEVMHLVSLVTGTERADRSLADDIAAVFPGGTITGAPKPRTMEIIDELEATQRGPYTGSITAFGFDGRATLNIVIRTLVRCGEEYHLRVGAGIVHDSLPEAEYDETLAKARGLVSAIDDRLDAATMELTRSGNGADAGTAVQPDAHADTEDQP